MKALIAALGLSVAAVGLAAPAHAAPDTHMPNGDALWCWGGKGTIGLVTPYCNGEPYPDGSYYRQLGFMQGMLQPLGWHPPECVNAAGDPFPDGCNS